MRLANEPAIIDSSALRGNRPLIFRCGASGPCLHVQILTAHRIDRGSLLDVPYVYAVIFWQGMVVGRTQPKDNTCNPVWEAETFVVPLAFPYAKWFEHAALFQAKFKGVNADLDLPVLRVELYDDNVFTKDEFLGQVSLTPRHIVQLLSHTKASGDEARAYPLKPRLASGSISVAAGRTELGTGGGIYIAVKVLACQGISEKTKKKKPLQANVTAYWDDEYLGETPLSGKLVWRDAVFNFHLCASDGPPKPLTAFPKLLGARTLRLEVRDHVGRVLGERSFSASDLVELIQRSDDATRRTDQRDLSVKKRLTTCVFFSKAHQLRRRLSHGRTSRFFGVRKKKDDETVVKRLPSLKLSHHAVASGGKLRRIMFGAAEEYKLELSDKHNGSDRVQGTVGLRMLYHTRGEILRGLDVGVSKMGLGERAVLRIRPDYAYDEAQPGPLVPPFAALDVTVDLLEVSGHSAGFIFAYRAVKAKVNLWDHQLRERWRLFQEKRPVVAFLLEKFALIFVPLIILLRILLACLLREWSEFQRTRSKFAKHVLFNVRGAKWLLGGGDDSEDDDDSDLDSDDGDVDMDWYDEQAQKDDLAEEEFRRMQEQETEQHHDDEDLMDFDDLFTDEELEKARQAKLRPAASLFRADNFHNFELTQGLTKLHDDEFTHYDQVDRFTSITLPPVDEEEQKQQAAAEDPYDDEEDDVKMFNNLLKNAGQENITSVDDGQEILTKSS